MEVTAEEALARTILLTQQERLPGVHQSQLLKALAGTTAAIVADETNLASPSAQAAVVTLVGLVAACGIRVRLVMPAVGVVGYQPPLIGDGLLSGLAELAADIIPGVEALVDRSTWAGDVVFVIGSTPWRGEAANAWRLVAEDWSGSLLRPATAARPITAHLPLGALGAATAAAAEPYRAALRRLAAAGSQVTDQAYLLPAAEVLVRLAEPATPFEGFPLKALDLVSGGALSSALLHVLLRVDELELDVRVWEPEDADGTNLNRYTLLRRSMLPVSKIEMLDRWMRPRHSLAGFRHLVDEAQLQDIGEWAPWVFVGADRVEARWLVQGTWPEHLVVGGTVGFMAMASEHDRLRPCARCLHPAANPPGPAVATISFVSYFGGLLAASRLLRWSIGPSAKDQQVVAGYPDRLDSETGFLSGPVTRRSDCPICSVSA